MGSRCPKCMNRNVYDSSLLPQPTLELAAHNWRIARPELFQRQNQVISLQQLIQSASPQHAEDNPRKRQKSDPDSYTRQSPPRRRSARNHRSSKASNGIESVVIEDSGSDVPDDEGQDDASKTSKDYRKMEANDMVECPLCQYTFTLVALNRHLDKGTCSPGDPEPSPQERGLHTSKTNGPSPAWFQKPAQCAVQPKKKIVRPNYDMLKQSELKRVLEEFRLSTNGERKRLVDRHRFWTNIYNANLDASERMRKSDMQLRRDLEAWERAQDLAIQSGGLSEKKTKAWALDHQDDFRRLAMQARMSHQHDRSKHTQGHDKTASHEKINEHQETRDDSKDTG